MNNPSRWAQGILIWGIVMVVLAIIVAGLGIIGPSFIQGFILPEGLVIGAVIMLLILGIASIAQYVFVRVYPASGRHMMIREHDERMQTFRERAGYHAYVVAGALGILMLLWVAFAGQVGLPAPAGSLLFYAMLVLVGVPYLAYIISIAVQQARS